MRNKLLQSNIDNSDPVNFPDGRIKNDDGSGNGTPVNEQVYGDIHENFAKVMRLAGKSFNNLAESEQNGYQFLDALRQMANKNNLMKPMFKLGTTGKIGCGQNLDHILKDESWVFLSSIDITTETILSRGTGGQTAVGVQLNVDFKGSTIKSGDYVRFVKTNTGCDLIRLADGDSFGDIADVLGFLKAATQLEEDAGISDEVATTPLTNFTAFAERVIGAASVNFLATQIANGLMSAADKLKLDNLVNEERNYGTFGPLDVGGGNVGDFYPVTGDIVTAEIVAITTGGQEVEMTLNNAMADTNMDVRLNVQSLGNFGFDNDIRPLVFKVISTTKIRTLLEEVGGVIQNIVIHVSVIQR